MKNGNLPVYPDPMRGAEPSIVNQSPYELPEGLTKREYFAAMAMQGIIAGIYGGGGDNYQRQLNEWKIDNGPLTLVGTALAKDALGYADELLKALES